MVGEPMVGTGVVRGAKGAARVLGLVPWPEATEAPAVSALGVRVGGVISLNCARSRKESERGTNFRDAARVNRYYDRAWALARPGLGLGVEVSC